VRVQSWSAARAASCTCQGAAAKGERYVASGRVVKPGKRLSICQVEVHAYEGEQATLCVIGLLTAVRVTPR
ncbi:hypothetical protein SB751_32140, partial [Cupriavidus sp. SIMBA_020]